MENYNTQGFSFDLPKGNSSIIKVIGVGGGGNNALKHMYERGIHGVDFVICNTDAQTLDNNPVANKVQLGISTTEGLGAGADPEVGEKAAIESIDEIKAAMGQNTKMVFITAGMGGGTGTGAAPVIAKVAKEMGILTVGIVTVPFSFEGKRRLDQAELGLEKLRNNVDSLIVINNDKLRQQFGNLGFKQGFSKADEVLTNAAKGMAEVITGYFDVNIDFRDAKSVLQNSGTALMSTGSASGENKAEEAVKKALDSPLLNDNKITGAKNVLLLIRSGSQEVTMDEIGIIMDHIQQEAGNTADIIFGVGTDEELEEQVSVLVIATGFAKDNQKNTAFTEKVKYNLNDTPRNSPFKSASDREESSAKDFSSPTLFRLDDEDETGTPDFPKNTAALKEIKSDFKIIDREEKYRQFEENDDSHNTEPLFSGNAEPLAEQDLETQSFRFETDEKPAKDENTFGNVPPVSSQQQDEEKPMEYSFFINNAIPEFNFEEEKDNSSKSEDFAKPENNAANPETQLIPDAEPLTETEGFTFINKTVHSDKVAERRNKLKEFNSRYLVTEHESDFETIPAFRRKNITIDGNNASEQHVQTFLSENDKGQMQVRENRFLNKDVD